MISIIIPTFNEGDVIKSNIQKIKAADVQNLVTEIIVSDGGSTDATLQQAQMEGAIVLNSPQKGRAAQMNYGAAAATGAVLFFLHADTLPPHDFSGQIVKAQQQGFASGCFRLRFDLDHWFLDLNSWATRFNVNNFRFGDQGLFIDKTIFDQSGKFLADHIVMEDQEFIKRIKKTNSFIVLKSSVTTSARKYIVNGVYKTQAVFFLIYFMYYLGFSQARMISTYKKLLRQQKL